MLDFVDDKAAGLKGLGAVGRGNCHNYGRFADLQRSRPVDRLGAIKTKALNCVIHDPLAFLLRHCGMSFILQADYLTTLMGITHGALEYGNGTCVRIARGGPEGA